MSQLLHENLAKLDLHLARFRNRTLGHLIDGEEAEGVSGETFTNTTPVDDSPVNEVARGAEEDVTRATRAAVRAFGEWRDMPGARRRGLLHGIADAIEARAEEIALVESYDTGQPLRFMSSAALRGAENFRFYADRAPEARNGLSTPADQHVNYSVRQPIGPVGVITPWNTPFMLSTWKIAPALAAGCTVVHKPAEWSPLSASILAEICRDAGLPAGVLNTVHGLGEEAGVALTEQPDIRAIAFVGESQTGRAIMSQGASTLKRWMPARS
jgi:5-carboxymethyl-2-hydroxymuconic-semialdehyde dehydrogenase